MSKTLLGLMRDLNGAPSDRSPPQSAPCDIPDNALRRVWPTLASLILSLILAPLFLGRFLVDARVISQSTMLRASLVLIAMLAVFYIVQEIFERWKLIDDKPARPLVSEDDIPVVRPPPPINEEAPKSVQQRPRVSVSGGELPAEVCVYGRSATWRLEGDYEWRPDQDKVEPSRMSAAGEGP